MGYLQPPHLSTKEHPSYAQGYAQILSAHRRSPLTSASSVIILVARDVDALCAARMLAELFRQDDVTYRIIPVAGIEDGLKKASDIKYYKELHTLIFINLGATLELGAEVWFGEVRDNVWIHVIDSHRPYDLSNIFEDNKVVVWDDGSIADLERVAEAYRLQLSVPSADDPQFPGFDDEETDDDEPEDDEEEDDLSGEEYEDYRGASGKRRSLGDGENRKRRKVDEDGNPKPKRVNREEWDESNDIITKFYTSGTWFGQSAAGIIYALATIIERADNELLWLAILGLTEQYISSRISRESYDMYQAAFNDEVARLNVPRNQGLLTTANANVNSTTIVTNPDDTNIRATEELRFTLFRHWTLYDAMYHSSYVASKLGIWKERGRKRLTGLLAKMGFSIPQTQQPYAHMDIDLKSQLLTKLDAIAPEYGLVELTYPSFLRCYGWRGQPLSAADAVEAVGVLLDVAGGIRVEVEVEGARNGGEWFGGGKLWEGATISGDKEGRRRKIEERENVPPAENGAVRKAKVVGEGEDEDEDAQEEEEVGWWVRNFWTAYDALGDITRLQPALPLSMSIHRAIIRQGTSIIDKHDIRTMRTHRVVTLTQGPDLPLFVHPGVLSRLALWLVDALRDRVGNATVGTRGKGKKKSLPFVVACLDEPRKKYIIVGVTGALDFGDVRKNQFAIDFMSAKAATDAHMTHISFNTNVIELAQDDLKMFLERLCEGSEA